MNFKSKSTITLGHETVEVAVLNGGKRLVKTADIGKVFPPISNISEISSSSNLRPLMTPDVHESIAIIRQLSGPLDYVNVTVVMDVLDLFLDARNKGVLDETQLEFAKIAERLTVGFARIAIFALVDEATGFQNMRQKQEFSNMLADDLSKEGNPEVTLKTV